MTLSVEKLNKHHPVIDFDCGDLDLNQFLIDYALKNQQANAAQTYVALENSRVIGYYSLAVGSAFYDDAPSRIKQGLAKHPVPLMILARLAVSLDWQRGRGIGAGLLKDAMLRTVQASEIAGIRAMVAHAKDENATGFYRHFEFIPSPTDPLHRYLLLKDLKKLAAP
jgi:predicted N-acetyltransferase YhbS